ncbi:polyphenol oxidase family protein [Actinotalea sp. M2MS4P-6]|uniref:polyphenol oxidase family protein n=1 Tax=Actinotalea sp. M2MS4P-6 TaxID=2983762 RepID=UPI0021E489DB|nr:polyphenol oxidase family protein [Actinotalea sp. M2MS4P-6]MCV2393416.1 polyphenol oxidase family protein [Actinotalea sp. M2MS4P-6]
MTVAPWLEVDLGPGVRAGFSTVELGNLGLAVGDDPDAVARRRRLVAQWAGGPVAWAHQVHGTAVHLALAGGDDVASCDALVGTGPVGLAVQVADCVPVLLADAAAGVVGAAHAGRRGLVAGVVDAAVRAMHAAGATRIRAVVGPAICGACYEVPAELRDEVEAAVPGTSSTTSWGTPALDLPGAVVALLAARGVAVDDVGLCTRTDPRFYSHRGAGQGAGPAGRIAGVVRLT